MLRFDEIKAVAHAEETAEKMRTDAIMQARRIINDAHEQGKAFVTQSNDGQSAVQPGCAACPFACPSSAGRMSVSTVPAGTVPAVSGRQLIYDTTSRACCQALAGSSFR